MLSLHSWNAKWVQGQLWLPLHSILLIEELIYGSIGYLFLFYISFQWFSSHVKVSLYFSLAAIFFFFKSLDYFHSYSSRSDDCVKTIIFFDLVSVSRSSTLTSSEAFFWLSVGENLKNLVPKEKIKPSVVEHLLFPSEISLHIFDYRMFRTGT